MSVDEVTRDLQGLAVSNGCLLFKPTGTKAASISDAFDNIPRYLFRISTPCSDGMTDETWVRSRDETWATSEGELRRQLAMQRSRTDIFSRDEDEAAKMVWRHLTWRDKEQEDNLVSWTSSLLFALQYTFYRHYNDRNSRSPLDKIYLFVIDTNMFEKGTFIRDLDIIRPFVGCHSDLTKLYGLRTEKSKFKHQAYYFGEYLSQGSLKIENKSQRASAQQLIDNGLYKLLPALQMINTAQSIGQALWANAVLDLRKPFIGAEKLPPCVSEVEIQAAKDISQLFEQGWRLAVAAHFLALVPRQGHDKTLLEFFEGETFTDAERWGVMPINTIVGPSEHMPEVQQYNTILRGICNTYNMKTFKGHLRQSEIKLKLAIQRFGGLHAYPEEAARIVEQLGRIGSLSRNLAMRVESNDKNV